MDCLTVLLMLPDYVEGSLPADMAKSIEQHLPSCSACKEEHAHCLDEGSLLIHSPSLPVDYHEFSISGKVMDRIMQENKWASPSSVSRKTLGLSRFARRTGMIAAFVFLLLFTWPLLNVQKEASAVSVTAAQAADGTTDTVSSMEQLQWQPERPVQPSKIQYGVVASIGDPIVYKVQNSEHGETLNYGFLASLFGILMSVVTMSWLSHMKDNES
jgi:hypothetical protein